MGGGGGGGGGDVLEISWEDYYSRFKSISFENFLATLSSSKSLVVVKLVGWYVSWSVGLLVSMLDTFVKSDF